MSLLTDAISAALRSANTPQMGASGSQSLADALRSLLAPRAAAAGAPADTTQAEGDALHELLTRFERSGYADIVRSWIGPGANQPIEPHQVGHALGAPSVEELANQTGLPPETLLAELARLLPTVIDRLTPQGRLDRERGT
jgi:uncharacterized protein YidB (DUF937 family)